MREGQNGDNEQEGREKGKQYTWGLGFHGDVLTWFSKLMMNLID
jgi:hypothetical protein